MPDTEYGAPAKNTSNNHSLVGVRSGRVLLRVFAVTPVRSPSKHVSHSFQQLPKKRLASLHAAMLAPFQLLDPRQQYRSWTSNFELTASSLDCDAIDVIIWKKEQLVKRW